MNDYNLKRTGELWKSAIDYQWTKQQHEEQHEE